MNKDKYKIIISISHRRISFEYWQKGSGEEKLLSIPGCEKWSPLAFYCSPIGIVIGEEAQRAAFNGTIGAFDKYFELLGKNITYQYALQEKDIGYILLDATESILNRFYSEVLYGKYGTLTDNRATIPLTIVCESDIEPNERAYLSNLFGDSGYTNLTVADYDDYIAQYCCNTIKQQYSCNNVLVAWTEGVDLRFTLFDVKQISNRQQMTLSNLGIDPRLCYVEERIWEDLIGQNSFLSREDVNDVIHREAINFLNSTEPIVRRTISLSDGYKYSYYLDRKRFNFIQNGSGLEIRSELEKFLQATNIDKAGTILILRGIAANNPYFEQVLSYGFLETIKTGNRLRNDVMRLIINERSLTTEPTTPTEPLHPRPITKPVHTSLTTDFKKQIRIKRADINARIRCNDYKAARALIADLQNMLHEHNIENYDDELEELLKQLPVTKKVFKEPKREEKKVLTPASLPQKNWKREVKVALANACGSVRAGDKEAAVKAISELVKRLHADGEYSFDSALSDFVSENSPAKPIRQTPKSVAKTKAKTEAEKLLAEGRFSEAKRKFAKEQNSEMAQECSTLIRSSKILERYQSTLDLAKRSKNASSIAIALKDLSQCRMLYQKYNINTLTIDKLISEFKSIK